MTSTPLRTERAADAATPVVGVLDAPVGSMAPADSPALSSCDLAAAASGAARVDVSAVDAGVVMRWRHELVRAVGGLAGSSTDGGGLSVVRARGDDRGGCAAGPSAALIELIAALEGLKSAACSLQAEAAVALDRAERERQAHEGVPARRRGLGVAAQVGLARRESPHRGAALVGAAKAWLSEMPHTFGALRDGLLSEHRAMLLVQETACLEVEDRREVDALLCADPSTLVGIGTRQLVASARTHAARLDPAAAVRRARRAQSERCVTLRAAPDTMTYLTALLPVAQGVAVFAALGRAADAAAAGVPPERAGAAVGGGEDGRAAARRGRGQVMADTLVELVTGQSSTAAVPLTVNLVLSDSALLGAGHEPGHVSGGGPVPAQVARELVAAGVDAGAVWLRRLYADPGGDLVAMTSRARFHPDGLAEFLRIRDQGICRTPYCGAPVRHIDHIVSSAAGGATTAANGEGLCVACNLAKEAPGWSRRPLERAGPGHHVLTTTPTGHEYLSRAPSPPTPARSTAVKSDEGSVTDVRAVVGERSAIDACFSGLVAEYEEFAA